MKRYWKFFFTVAVIIGVFFAAVIYHRFSAPDAYDCLWSPDPYVRSVSRRLVEQDIERYEKRLLDAAVHGNTKELADALVLLASAQASPEIESLLSNSMTDDSPDVRAAAAFAAGELRLAAPALRQLAEGNDMPAIIAALALLKFDERELSPVGPNYPPHAFHPVDFSPEEYAGLVSPEREKDFFARLIRYLSRNTALDFSKVTPGKISFTKGWISSYNSRTGEIHLGRTPATNFSVMASHLLHETTVINLGGLEHYGRMSINTSYTHNLAVMVEMAYCRLTGVSVEYLWHQVQTMESRSDKFEAEKWFVHIARWRSGEKFKPCSIIAGTVFAPSFGLPNYMLDIGIEEEMLPGRFIISPRAYPF